MRRRFFPRPATIVLGVVALVCNSEAAAGAEGRVHLFVGQKWLDEEGWAPERQQESADQRREFGALMSFGRSDWPVAIAVDVLASEAEIGFVRDSLYRYEFRGATRELALGVRKTWQIGGVHAGIATGFGWPRESPSVLDSRRDGPARDHDAQRRGDRHVHLFVGRKTLSSESAPLDGHKAFGIVTTTGRATWPVSIAVDAFYSEKTALTSWASELGGRYEEMNTYELALGVRKIWPAGIVRFGVGGGIARISAARGDVFGHADYAYATGPWAATSCYVHARGFDAGVHLRWSRAKIEVPEFGLRNEFDADIGGAALGITLGYGW